MQQFSSKRISLAMTLVTAVLALLFSSGQALANERQGTVLLSDAECGYVLLDLGEGQGLVKLIRGEQPRPGDRLRGTLEVSEFSDMENQRTREPITVWVDMVERSSTRALTRFSQNCRR